MKTITQTFGVRASGEENSPLEIYDLFLDSQTVRLVNYDQNVSFFDINGISATYIAFPTKREVLERSVENPINTIVCGVSNIDRSMSSYLATNEFRGRRIVIRKIFADQLTSSGDCVYLFDGIMDAPAANEDIVQINAVDRIGTLNKEAPRRWYQLLCNNKFMDEQCGYGRTSGDMYVSTNGTCSGDCTDLIVHSSTIIQSNNYWKDGEIKITSGSAGGQRRKVVASSGDNTVNLDINLTVAPASGDNFTISRGCDKTWLRCSGDFLNDTNFIGFPTLPNNMVIRGWLLPLFITLSFGVLNAIL